MIKILFSSFDIDLLFYAYFLITETNISVVRYDIVSTFLKVTSTKMHPLVRNLKPLGFLEYVKLQENAFIVLSDSGTLTEESAMRQFPAVLIRTSTERPEGVEAGSIVVYGIDKEGIMLAIDTELIRYKFASTPENYDVEDVSSRVVEHIKTKIDVVNREIWGK